MKRRKLIIENRKKMRAEMLVTREKVNIVESVKKKERSFEDEGEIATA